MTTSALAMTAQGLFCPLGDFHIDPLCPVERALITHGHADHARQGHSAVLATEPTLAVMLLRYGEKFADRIQSVAYGERLRIGDAIVSFHPAGHILGSAQIRIETGRQVVVVSGDYKRVRDPVCAPFELLRCDVFVTEATFGLPIFRHPNPGEEVRKLLDSAAQFSDRPHLVGAYALGKAQRLAALLRQSGWERPLFVHGGMEKMMDFYSTQGFDLGQIRKISGSDRRALSGEIILCPPSALKDIWAQKFRDPVRAMASGWMRVRARARQRSVELPLVISDHADWDELCGTIRETDCEEVWITHGAEDALAHWAKSVGLAAKPLRLIGYADGDELLGADDDSGP